MLEDSFHRQITYLRISVTDRCNLRCIYCMPAEGIAWQPHTDILTYEEITNVVKAAAGLGINSIRLTGGDPLVRKGITRLVRLIAEIPQITDISLTTNGILLKSMAKELADSGLHRVNISLDTLDEEKYVRINRGGSLKQVWEGIEAAENEGIKPIKINTVVLRGINEDELLDLAALSLEHAWHIRFIEYMPVFKHKFPQDAELLMDKVFIPVQEMMANLNHLGLEPLNSGVGKGPAREYRLNNAPGTIGFISPISEHFCQSCNRLRLTADGNLRPCLLSDLEIPLRQALRSGGEIQPLIEQAVSLKPPCHHLDTTPDTYSRTMREIGG